ncbi:hypothetical protein PILCRDRAFT_17538 [Piloderma croceum F 1598]|uniref:Uncharacterized protein n=1 Tax=Piloderma croceum (strain F 1598) TaxID=765440 RepID=A0A0C3ES83_PILCF|nr:hypothetical protein PILCRDRAFT_17538 [Piloderma croceum F 1598]
MPALYWASLFMIISLFMLTPSSRPSKRDHSSLHHEDVRHQQNLSLHHSEL